MRVVPDHPLKSILFKPEYSRRLLKWGIELSEFDIYYISLTAIKSQALTNFLVDFPRTLAIDMGDESHEQIETLYVDGASEKKGVGIVLKSPSGTIIQHTKKIDFSVINN